MTLITAVATRDWVALAGDRRLTWHDSLGRVTRQTDADTKIATIDGEILVGYTGVVPFTDPGGFGLWLADLVRPLTVGAVTPFLQRRLTELWAATPGLTGQGFMLVTVGFVPSALGIPGEAQIVLISNSIDDHGDFNPHGPVSKEFEVHTESIDRWAVMTQGYPVSANDVPGFTDDRYWDVLNDEVAAHVCRGILDLHKQASDDSQGSVGTATLIMLMTRSAFRSAVMSCDFGGALAVQYGTGSMNDGPVDLNTQLVAHFYDPLRLTTIAYQPGMIGTGRGNYPTFVGGQSGLVGPGEKLPPARPLTDTDRPGY